MLKPARKKIPLPMGMVLFCYENGWTVSRIARDVGMSDTNIRNHLVRNGVKINAKPHQRDDLVTSQIVQEFLAGSSKKALARKYKCQPSTIRYRLKKAGIV